MVSPTGPVSWTVATLGSEGLGEYAEPSTFTAVLFSRIEARDSTAVRSGVVVGVFPMRFGVSDASGTTSRVDASASEPEFSSGSWVVRATPRIVSPWSSPVSGTTTVRWVEDRTATASRSQLFSRSSFAFGDVTGTRTYALMGTFFSGSIVWDLTETRLGASLYSTSSLEVRDRTGVRIVAVPWAPDWEFIFASDATATRSVVLFGAIQSALALQDASGSRTWAEVEPKAWLEPPRAIVGQARRRSSRLQSV